MMEQQLCMTSHTSLDTLRCCISSGETVVGRNDVTRHPTGGALHRSHLGICEGLADGVVDLGRLAAAPFLGRDVDQAQPVASPRRLRSVAERFLVEFGVASFRAGGRQGKGTMGDEKGQESMDSAREEMSPTCACPSPERNQG